ncbi:hypothetical protein F4V43_01535 [Paenibacillus spiritus]|uniref:Uncharacterized protein n=1 Tax=Paenibacillus spiritus TaxID=2496557 RepID=A0A5J5GG77_9BACL|nr:MULTISPECIES: hypothetical protein [Paenibacillus]KAA9007195.1 hypothetical protein F4V43_01535 [Paenibacillus spiritus]
MSRRSNRSQMLYTLGFLFLLVSAFAVFFTGVKVGADKTEAKYVTKNAETQSAEGGAYSQQELVNYYHNVFSPYREFKAAWNGQLNRLSGSLTSRERASVLKTMAELADKSYSEVTRESLFSDSPLLEQGQLNSLKSIRLFAEAAKAARDGGAASQSADALGKGELSVGAVKYGLLGQKNYYDAMVVWGGRNNAQIPGSYKASRTISLKEWSSMPLLLKNAISADMMLNRKQFESYEPQDLSAKIDDLIHSGAAQSLSVSSAQKAFSLLVSTGALQENDYSRVRVHYYSSEVLPQLPFFYE